MSPRRPRQIHRRGIWLASPTESLRAIAARQPREQANSRKTKAGQLNFTGGFGTGGTGRCFCLLGAGLAAVVVVEGGAAAEDGARGRTAGSDGTMAACVTGAEYWV